MTDTSNEQLQHMTSRNDDPLFLAAIVQSSDDAIVGDTLDGIIVSWNKGAEQLYGYSAQEVLGKSVSMLIPEEFATEFRLFFEMVKKGEKVAPYETVRIRKDGKKIDIIISLSPVRDATGMVIGAASIAWGITERARYARSLIEASLDPLVTISPEGKITDVNEATIQITGVQRGMLVGSDFTSYFTDPEEARQIYQLVFKEGFVRDYQLTLRHTSGALTDVLYNASVYKDDKGKVLGVFAAARDITDRNKIEEKLHDTSAYSRSLIESSLDPLVTISPDGKITDVNGATEKMTGVAREWLIGTDFSIYFTEPRRARECYRRVLKDGTVRDFPLSVRHVDGQIIDVLFNASLYKDEVGKVRGIFGAARDVTETKQASRYTRSLIEASLDPLVMISPEGKITDVNEATIKVTGVSREELIGTDFSNYFTAPEEARAGYEKVFKQGFVTDYPLTIRSKEGKLTDVLYNASVYKDDKGNVLGIFATARDYTRTKQDTDEVKAINKELEAFSYSVSHDLRAPLRAIDGFAKVLSEEYQDKLDEEGKRLIGIIKNNAIQMGKLIDDLLAFSRLGRQEVKKEKVDMSVLVNDVYQSLKQEFPERIIEFTLHPLTDAMADPAMMRLVWQNLLSNAIKFTKNKDPAIIEVGSTNDESIITYFVKDNGAGYDMKYKDKLFGVFQRLHDVKDFEGTGVGLANVKRIVERHGGVVWAEGAVGEGAVFNFSLPII